MKTISLLVASLLVAGNWAVGEGEPDLDNPKVREKILKEAVVFESLERRRPEGETLAYRESLAYQAGKKTPYTGWAKRVYDNGQVEELSHFKDGRPDGLWTGWHENGRKASEAHFKDGKAKVTSWHESGKKAGEKYFKDGTGEGLHTRWYDNGQKMQEAHYKDGKEDGLWTGWHKNGQKAHEVHFKNGKKDGPWTEWDEDGKVVKQTRYKDGVEVKE